MQKRLSLIALCVVLAANAAACPESEDVTEDQLPTAFRRALEHFRVEAEFRREVLEDDRMLGAINHSEYLKALAVYREDIAAYRAGFTYSKNPGCGVIENGIFGFSVLPANLDPEYDLVRGNDAVLLRIRYYYTGDRGSEVSLGALTYLDGNSTGHWAYRPYRLWPGFHVALVRLSMSNDAPDGYRSDEISTEMFINGKSVFHTQRFPFVHEWRRRTSDEPQIISQPMQISR